MDPISAIGIVIGLVGSLGNTLQVLEDLASRFTSEKFGSDFKDAHIAISKSRSDLARIQGNIRITWMQSQPDDLLDVLQDTRQRLKRLRDTIQHAERFRTKLFLRWQSHAPLKNDTDVAKSSIDLALQMLIMIGRVQGRTQETEPFIEESRWNSRGMIARTQYLASVWQRSHAPLLLTAPDLRIQQIFAWMAIPEEQDSFHQRCRAERVAGTCDWFLETKEYENWREQPVTTGDESMLWCQGKPGIGKTVLASRVIDRLRTSYNVAYFYMSSGGRLHSATDVATSLLRQLCLPFHIVPERLEQLYEQSGRETNAPLELEDMLEALIEVSRGIDQPVMIVVDALDECNMREQKEFVKVLASLKETSWKSLVTSRFDQDILSRAYGGCYQFLIEDDNVESDIRNFVDSAIRGNEPVDTMLRDRDLRLEVIETLISRAHGMFYWVSLQLRRILDQTSISGIRQALATIPNDVGGIVKSALDMIKIQHSGRVQLAIRTLALLTAAKAPTTAVVPLTAGAMSHALGIAHVLDSEDSLLSLREDEIPNAESIAECCMGLVAIDPVTRVVTLAHFDIAQYIQTHWDELFSWKEKLMLANITLAYLSLNVFSTGPCHQADALSKRLEAYPFLDYASRYWGHHAREAMSPQDAVTENGRQKLIAEVDWLLRNRMNLESSLQVCDLNARPSRVREALLRSNGKDFALHAKKFGSVSELQVATRHGLFITARSIIESRPDQVIYQDDFGTSALHEAAQGGWADIVGMLLKAGAPSFLMNQEEKSPLYYAAQNGDTEIISMLSEAKHTSEIHPERSDPPITPSEHMQRSGRIETAPLNEDQVNPLALEEAFCEAAGAGRLGVIEKLLKQGSNPNSKKDGKPAINYAIQGEHESILNLLLDAGALISVPDDTPSGLIPLHQAIRFSNSNIAHILLEYGADIETRDVLGRTVLFETLDDQSLDGACLLLDKGISISSCDFQRNTVLHEAARRGAVEHASLFIDQGIGLDKVNEEGMTPLHLATRNGHYRIVNMLLKKGAKVESLDKIGWTPLMYAASAGSAQLCQILVSYGANVATASNDHQTSLMLAAQKGHDQIIRLLLEYGADVNAVEQALSLAAHAGHAQVVRLLLDDGADMNALDKDSRTALVQAVDNGHASIVQLLLESGADPYKSELELRKLSRRTTKTSSKRIWQLLRDHGFRFDSD